MADDFETKSTIRFTEHHSRVIPGLLTMGLFTQSSEDEKIRTTKNMEESNRCPQQHP